MAKISRKELKHRLKEIQKGEDGRKKVVAFAYRSALRALPLLGRKGNFNFWKKKREKHAFSVFRALDAVEFSLKSTKNSKINFNFNFAAAYAAAYAAADVGAAAAAAAAAADAAAAAAYAADAADAAYAAYAAYAADAADAADAAAAAAAAADADAAAADAALDLDLKFLEDKKNSVNSYLALPLWNQKPEEWDTNVANLYKAIATVGLGRWRPLFEKRFSDRPTPNDENLLRRIVEIPEVTLKKDIDNILEYLDDLDDYDSEEKIKKLEKEKEELTKQKGKDREEIKRKDLEIEQIKKNLKEREQEKKDREQKDREQKEKEKKEQEDKDRDASVGTKINDAIKLLKEHNKEYVDEEILEQESLYKWYKNLSKGFFGLAMAFKIWIFLEIIVDCKIFNLTKKIEDEKWWHLTIIGFLLLSLAGSFLTQMNRRRNTVIKLKEKKRRVESLKGVLEAINKMEKTPEDAEKSIREILKRPSFLKFIVGDNSSIDNDNHEPEVNTKLDSIIKMLDKKQ